MSTTPRKRTLRFEGVNETINLPGGFCRIVIGEITMEVTEKPARKPRQRKQRASAPPP